jgi:hypothetical protein
MPWTCESIYRKEFRKISSGVALGGLQVKVLLVAVQTTFLQERAITLCEERVYTDP